VLDLLRTAAHEQAARLFSVQKRLLQQHEIAKMYAM